MKEVFATRLVQLRGDRTKQQFARYLGITQPTYLRYEDKDDETLPKIDVLLRISKTCGVSADWLLGNTNNEPIVKDGAERKLDGMKKVFRKMSSAMQEMEKLIEP